MEAGGAISPMVMGSNLNFFFKFFSQETKMTGEAIDFQRKSFV